MVAVSAHSCATAPTASRTRPSSRARWSRVSAVHTRAPSSSRVMASSSAALSSSERPGADVPPAGDSECFAVLVRGVRGVVEEVGGIAFSFELAPGTRVG